MQIIRKKYNWASPLFKRNKTNKIILHHAQAKTCSVEKMVRFIKVDLKIQSERMLKVQIMIQSVFVLKEIS